MKTWILLWTLLTAGVSAHSSVYTANFDDHGFVEVSDTRTGLLVDVRLHLETKEKYMIEFLSNCRLLGPSWRQFRHSMQIQTTSDTEGLILRSFYFPGMHEADLKSRKLNTLALSKLEKSRWEIRKCVALDSKENKSFDSNEPVQP